MTNHLPPGHAGPPDATRNEPPPSAAHSEHSEHSEHTASRPSARPSAASATAPSSGHQESHRFAEYFRELSTRWKKHADELVEQSAATRRSLKKLRRSVVVATVIPLVGGVLVYMNWPYLRHRFALETRSITQQTIQDEDVQDNLRQTVIKVLRDPKVKEAAGELMKEKALVIIKSSDFQTKSQEVLKKVVLRVLNDPEVLGKIRERSVDAVQSVETKRAIEKVLLDPDLHADAGIFLQNTLKNAIWRPAAKKQTDEAVQVSVVGGNPSSSVPNNT
eukprot:ANDGO_03251.mRNA.1 hypothetical protein